MNDHLHPALRKALKPFEPKPCAHAYARDAGGGVFKCIDCGYCFEPPYIPTEREILQQECNS
jgi:hypothetical protein